ncbi:MarR family winged helix-turn-helix transcriptional regulator [Streptomyces cocklensis]|jgi:DNA-binding MarR family transcriptional regulator|uniref:Transcriptional regulator, MarR family n=1 Tax=Actinacidiphila cocklensis TaxID=887465 RepID=A0A9W4DN46_9ACTN|nr:MarR family winged helix-turn-helix transcriptional regulator [Actinacidiphila cocklensis]MDD1057992.1 MarR family winged helix-turn-helix transcriptional regulator [Actinacidiphila cocklensis]WSX79561.1 MarR family winged helix-turn-helix transcriptional regulator [Streptomyces sp. NBC_00899]CAG6393010.1 Transcriptional regulator, MarR family [Actinacidiphila cocklensis]
MNGQQAAPPHADTAALAGELRVALAQLVRRLREQADGMDLTRSQSSVLLRLERDGAATATALARAEGVRPQSMAKIVQALDAAGLVSGAPDPKDGRKTLLSITEAAREEFRTGRLAKEDWLTRALDTMLSPAEIEQLASTADLLRRLAQSP